MKESLIIAETARLLADTSRATMMLALLDGRAYTANELARAANVSPQTASFHLGKLGDANFVQFVTQGRHRYFRLAGPEIAQTLEGLLASAQIPAPDTVTNSCPGRLRAARYCYDHLAGRLGVAIYRAMLGNDWLVPEGQHMIPTAKGMAVLDKLDIQDDRSTLQARPCLDWSERKFHLAGGLGRVLLQAMLDKRWLLRGKGRAITLTEEGRRQLWLLGVSDRATAS